MDSDSFRDEERPPGSLAQTIGPFLIVECLGAGGMGVVYRARQTTPVAREVALKVIKVGMDTDHLLARFRAEREVLARLEHSGIARMFDAGSTADGRPWFAMELVPGVPLLDYCADRRLPVASRLQLFQRICAAVQHAHQKGVVHRDLKPANVLVVDESGHPQPKVIDFGLAHVTSRRAEDWVRTRIGEVMGTPGYMSPEQLGIGSLDVDARADVYALGAVLYQMLCGVHPLAGTDFQRMSITQLQEFVRTHEPVPPSVRAARLSGEVRARVERGLGLPADRLCRLLGGDLDRIVAKAMHLDRGRRYATPDALAEDVGRHLNGQPVEAMPDRLGYRLRKLAGRHRLAFGSAAAVAAATVAGLIGTLLALDEMHAANRRFDLLALPDVLAGKRAELAGFAVDRTADRSDVAELHTWHRATAAWVEAAVDAVAQAQSVIGTPRGAAPSSGPASANAFLAEALAEFGPELVSFRDGPLHRLADDLAFIESGRAEAGRSNAAAWAACRGRLGVPIPIQPDLLPLGPDPQSGLEEFAVIGTGSLPTRGADRRLRFDEEHAIVLVFVPPATASLGVQITDDKAPNFVRAEVWFGDAYSAFDASQRGEIFRVDAPVRSSDLGPTLIGKHELSQAQWLRMTGHNPSWNPDGGRYPLENVQPGNAWVALRRYGLSLPDVDTWEHLARGGSTAGYPHGSDPAGLVGYANLSGREVWRQNPRTTTHSILLCPDFDDGECFPWEVGSALPNGFGLHDVCGNVAELCLTERVEQLQAAEFRTRGGASNQFVREALLAFDGPDSAPAASVGVRVVRYLPD